MKFQANLKRQLELIRMNARPMPNNMTPVSGATMPMTMPMSMPMSTIPVPMNVPSAPPYVRQNSNNSNISANDDGWVLVPSQAESDA